MKRKNGKKEKKTKKDNLKGREIGQKKIRVNCNYQECDATKRVEKKELRKKERKKERKKDRKKERKKERRKDRQTDRNTDR